jgi:hypothetical protein
MGNGEGGRAEMERIYASTAAIAALFLEDASLDSGTAAGSGVDVLQRRYELRLDRMHLVSRLEAQLAGINARDAATQTNTPTGNHHIGTQVLYRIS